jgi:hypothetical protein
VATRVRHRGHRGASPWPQGCVTDRPAAITVL